MERSQSWVSLGSVLGQSWVSLGSVLGRPASTRAQTPGESSRALRNPGRALRNPGRALRSPAEPFGVRAEPFGVRAEPFGIRAEPFGIRAEPFGIRASTMVTGWVRASPTPHRIGARTRGRRPFRVNASFLQSPGPLDAFFLETRTARGGSCLCILLTL